MTSRSAVADVWGNLHGRSVAAGCRLDPRTVPVSHFRNRSRRSKRPCTIRSFAAAPSLTAPASRPSPATSRSTAIASARSAARPAPAKRDIAAEGMLVTPGWVDVHTHYDGQATWDQELAPSSWHGVTTILFGNCGVGFAPVRRDHHSSLIGLMEAVEEIPGITLSEGLKWDWESFPEYLDALAAHAARDRCRRAGAAPSAARLRDGRARDQSREGHRRGHRSDAPHDARGAGGGRVRLHHVAHQLAQDADRRDGAGPLFGGAGASRHRFGAEGPEARRVRREQRLRHRDARNWPG